MGRSGYRPGRRDADTGLVVPVIPPAGTADPFGRGDCFDLELAKVMCDVSVIPSLITLLEESMVPLLSSAAEYAAPATPALETVLESPGYKVPDESGFTWMPGFVPVSETVLEEEGATFCRWQNRFHLRFRRRP